jgi:hypothetical protein
MTLIGQALTVKRAASPLPDTRAEVVDIHRAVRGILKEMREDPEIEWSGAIIQQLGQTRKQIDQIFKLQKERGKK